MGGIVRWVMSDKVDLALILMCVALWFAPINIATGILAWALFVYFSARLSYFVYRRVGCDIDD